MLKQRQKIDLIYLLVTVSIGFALISIYLVKFRKIFNICMTICLFDWDVKMTWMLSAVLTFKPVNLIFWTFLQNYQFAVLIGSKKAILSFTQSQPILENITFTKFRSGKSFLASFNAYFLEIRTRWKTRPGWVWSKRWNNARQLKIHTKLPENICLPTRVSTVRLKNKN
jgi:hypothetical protein